MKNDYIQPSIMVVRLGLAQLLLTGSITEIDGPGMEIGGEGGGGANTKESESHNIWDEEW